jgi:chorismate mutase/prephenate dehydrogenase
MDPLEQLRERIRLVDRHILTLVRERLDLAAQIGREKKDRGIPLRDWHVERTVLDHAQGVCAELRLPTPLARNLMQQLLAESRAEQERLTYAAYTGSAETIVIIGGLGKMGRWLSDFFSNQGHSVGVFDVSEARRDNVAGGITVYASLAEALAATTFAAVAAPLDLVPQVIDDIANRGYRGTLFDIASLKGHLKPAIDKARKAGVAITSIHPMFGPGARALADQVICLCDCGDAPATQRVRGFFAETAATLVDLSLDEHDRIASYVLGLSHLTNILFTRVLMRGGDPFDAINRVGSTTFHSQMATTATVMRDNPELYFAIQKLNPYTPRLYAAIADELAALTRAVGANDRDAFVSLMRAGQQWLAAGG